MTPRLCRSIVVAAALVFAVVSVAGCGSNSSPTQPSVAPPVISLFAADATAVALGTSTTLRWEVLDNDASVRIDPMPGNVPAVGSTAIAPVGTTTFTLVARNANGSTQRFVTISVR